MGIPYKFELEGYCEGCPYFDSEQKSVGVSRLGERELRALHTIRCHNRDVCERIARISNQVIE